MPSDIEAEIPFSGESVSPDKDGLMKVVNMTLGVVVLVGVFTLGLFGYNKTTEAAGVDSDGRATLEVR